MHGELDIGIKQISHGPTNGRSAMRTFRATGVRVPRGLHGLIEELSTARFGVVVVVVTVLHEETR